ncbi:MAG: response regulator transcription factor [Firmicutes bacterium]|nr:response regulator transcription factor [Bacillota bacterium]
MAIRVLIADDHPLLREGLAKILAMEGDIEVVGEAQDGEEAVVRTGQCRPDIVLMDISMPKGGGLEATRAIARDFPEIGVIVLTIHDDEQYLYELIAAGARGYILKDSEPSRVVEAIRCVYEGGSYMPPDLMNKVLNEFRRLQTPGRPTLTRRAREGATVLTEREQEILRLIVDGRTNAEIARTLYISEKTVKNHITNLLRKLGLSDRTQAAVYALRSGLVKFASPSTYRPH